MAPLPDARLSAALGLLIRLRALVALVVLSVTFTILSPEFLTAGNLTILVKHVAINAILAIGMTFAAGGSICRWGRSSACAGWSRADC
jgi:erythritol transport system permease protein